MPSEKRNNGESESGGETRCENIIINVTNIASLPLISAFLLTQASEDTLKQYNNLLFVWFVFLPLYEKGGDLTVWFVGGGRLIGCSAVLKF